jgi:hypothetical protein
MLDKPKAWLASLSIDDFIALFEECFEQIFEGIDAFFLEN